METIGETLKIHLPRFSGPEIILYKMFSGFCDGEKGFDTVDGQNPA